MKLYIYDTNKSARESIERDMRVDFLIQRFKNEFVDEFVGKIVLVPNSAFSTMFFINGMTNRLSASLSREFSSVDDESILFDDISYLTIKLP